MRHRGIGHSGDSSLARSPMYSPGRERAFHLVSGRSWNGRYSVPVLTGAWATRAIVAVSASSAYPAVY